MKRSAYVGVPTRRRSCSSRVAASIAGSLWLLATRSAVAQGFLITEAARHGVNRLATNNDSLTAQLNLQIPTLNQLYQLTGRAFQLANEKIKVNE